MTSSTVEATVRLTLDDVGVVKLSRSTCAVHLGVSHQTDDRSSVGVDEERQ